MAVLLTGGAGYIGSHTAVELCDAGYDVVIADNFSNSSPVAVSRVESITGKKIRLYTVDVCDKPAMARVFAENKIDSVVHFAGLKAVGESVRVPLAYYRNNIDSTLTLLELMDVYGVKRLIFSSSATVYGARASLPYREDMETGPCTNPYGWTKLFIEQIIGDFAASRPDFSAVLLRYFNPVGAHESGLIGEDPRDIPNNLMPYIAKVAAGKLPCLNVFGNDYPTPDGTGVTDFSYVSHRYLQGRKEIEGLPFASADGEKTLEIKLSDRVTGCELFLYYTVFYEEDVISRYMLLRNRGNAPVKLEKCM